MSRGMWIGVILLSVVFIGIALIDAGTKRPIDWSESYRYQDKIPFGSYVFRQELPNILADNRTYTDFSESFYELLTDKKTDSSENSAIIGIDSYWYLSNQDIDKVLDYVGEGGEVFLSAKEHSEALLDTLGLQQSVLDYARFRPHPNRIYYTLGSDTSRIWMNKVELFVVFSKLNPENCTILGSLVSRGKEMPNFIRVKWGKGFIYLHTLPAAFSNYYLLQEQSYDYASKAINVVKSERLWLLDKGGNSGEALTPLRVILQKPGFAQAWYLLLIGLLLFMLFRSKREQRPVPVIIPEPNKSKEFAQTIGSLYYENGTPGNIIQKKIEYFLFDIRNNYQLDTWKLDDERFVNQLARKAGVNIEETRSLLELIIASRNKQNASLEDVKLINQRIEDFKQQANFI